jgi:hypothetical protein
MTLARRLDRLSRRYPWRRLPMPALDVSALTIEERHELDAILAVLEGAPLRPDGRPDLSALSDAELERLDALAAKVMLTEPA